MQNNNARQYLTMLGEAIAPHTIEWAVQDYGDGPTLVFTVPSPLDESSTFGCFIEPTFLTETITLTNLEITVFTDIPKELFAPLNRVIAAVNNALVLGAFHLFEETAEVVFRDGVILGTEIDTAAATQTILKTLAVMESGAINGGAELLKLIKGECTADELVAALNDVGGEAE